METERIIHKPFTDSDLDKLVEIRSDMDVAKYIGGEKATTRDWNRGRLDFYMSCYADKIGMHGMYWKKNGRMFGWSGLQPLQGSDDIEVSYGMAKEYWRKGIGYETASAWLEYGFRGIGLPRIVAVAMPENKGSWRIMEKLGMTFEKKDTFYEMECVVYGISREDWLKRD